MTLGIALIVFGAVALIAGAKNRAFADVLLGRDDTLPGGNVPATGGSGGGGDSPTVSSGGAASAGAYDPAWGPVHPVHVPGSLHYGVTLDNSQLVGLAHVAESRFHLRVHEFKQHGRAFDASGSVANMRAYAAYVALNTPGVTELFWNGPGARNIKNGNPVKRWFVSGHLDHVHTGI